MTLVQELFTFLKTSGDSDYWYDSGHGFIIDYYLPKLTLEDWCHICEQWSTLAPEEMTQLKLISTLSWGLREQSKELLKDLATKSKYPKVRTAAKAELEENQ
jgi:hypothetical protein